MTIHRFFFKYNGANLTVGKLHVPVRHTGAIILSLIQAGLQPAVKHVVNCYVFKCLYDNDYCRIYVPEGPLKSPTTLLCS